MNQNDINRYYQIYLYDTLSREQAFVNAQLWKNGLAKEINCQNKRRPISPYNPYHFNGLFDFFMGTLEKHHGF